MIHFLADLHLSPDHLGITRIFLDYLAKDARSAEQVFILGDLFGIWPGDDSIDDPDDPFPSSIIKGLRALTDSGVTVSVQHGNRDFLLGDYFAQCSGARILPDPYILSHPSRQFVLSHGDVLCTDDTEYQTFRQQVRTTHWQNTFLEKPLEERQAITALLRQQSELSKHGKPSQLMDVNIAATEDFLRCHDRITLIHGHTHLPAKHEHIVDGIHVERWVLSDWQDKRGEYLSWDGCQLLRHELR